MWSLRSLRCIFGLFSLTCTIKSTNGFSTSLLVPTTMFASKTTHRTFTHRGSQFKPGLNQAEVSGVAVRSRSGTHMALDGLEGHVDQVQHIFELAEAAPSIAMSAYQSALAHNPTGTDALTGMSLYFLGKGASGVIAKEPPCVVWLLRWMICGLCDGACTHQWYGFLDSLLCSSGLDHWTQASVMTFMSTFIYTPLYSCAFLAGLTLLEGKGITSAKNRIQKDFRELTSASILTWGPINLMLFGAVETELRVAVSEGVMFIYLIVLALWTEGFWNEGDVTSSAEAGASSEGFFGSWGARSVAAKGRRLSNVWEEEDFLGLREHRQAASAFCPVARYAMPGTDGAHADEDSSVNSRPWKEDARKRRGSETYP